MSETLTSNPIAPTVSAPPRRRFDMPVSIIEIMIGLGGCILAGALGWTLGAYLLLPFGATG